MKTIHHTKRHQKYAENIPPHYQGPTERLLTAVGKTLDAHPITACIGAGLAAGSSIAFFDDKPLHWVYKSTLLVAGVAIGVIAKEAADCYDVASNVQDPENYKGRLGAMTTMLERASNFAAPYLGQS